MKKLMSLAALAVVASVVAASAEDVLSANAVGYVKRTVPAGGFQIVSIPFDNLNGADDGTWKFVDTQVAQDIPVGSGVYFWNAEKQQWSPALRERRYGWESIKDVTISAGEPFFVQNNTNVAFDVTAAGEVPAERTRSRGYAGDDNLSFVASPYPVDVKFGATAIASNLPVNSQVMFWSVEQQQWIPGTKSKRYGWDTLADRDIEAGEGFFVQTTEGKLWEVAKPYTWPDKE